MLGLWASWMDRMAAPGQASAGQGKPWWQMTTDAPAPDVLAGGVQQLEEGLRKDPTLRSIDQMWNANPLREVVPIDWAEIARALRTVWLRSLRKPETAKAIVDFNTELWRSALQVWHEAGQRWLGMADTAPTQGPVSASADKRFAAPEWHTNPVYRTLKEVYLLASDWLMKQSDAVDDDLDEAERQRINFHLRQFVDAMSPTLMLMSNPAALQKAIETGGASVVGGRPQPDGRPQRRPPDHGGRGGLRAGAQPRAHAREGGPPQPPDRADPVFPEHRTGSQDAAADPAALDQQVLHPRHAAEEQHDPLSGRPGLHGVRDLLEEPGRLDGRHRHRGLHGPRAAGGQRRGARDHGQPQGQRHGLLHRRHAPDADARHAGRQGRRPLQLGELHGLDAGLRPRGRHGRVHGRAGASTSSSSR